MLKRGNKFWATLLVVVFMASLLPGFNPGTARVAMAAEDPYAGGVWLTGDHHMHTTASDGSESVAYDVYHAEQFGLDFIAITNHGGTSNYPKIAAEYDEIVGQRDDNPELLIFQGFEWNVPAGEHATFMVTPGANELDQVLGFMSLYDQSYNQEANTEQAAVDALVYAEQMNPQPLVLLNHPSRKGKYSIDEIRNYNDAGTVAAGFEGAPGHQANPTRGSYPGTEPGSSRTYGGYDKMTAEVGGLWDTLLAEGRPWFITANSDFHKHYSVGGDDMWPGEYSKTYVWAAEKDYADVMDSMREGRSFTVQGDLIDALEFTAATGDEVAGLGDTVTATQGDTVTVTIKVRDPGTQNNHGDNPTLQQVQLISNATGTPEITEVFTAADWQAEGGYLVMEHTFTNVTGDFYVRVRGSNSEELNPAEDPEDEDPWNDLWFYSNPIFVEATAPAEGDFDLTIMHTNDTHAHLDDIARRATVVNGIRAAEPNNLLLDAGDVFSGTLYFTRWQGQADLEFMDLLEYDAMGLGNHEFDQGPQTLAEFVYGAEFPIVNANFDFSSDGYLSPYANDTIGDEAAAGGIWPAVIKEVGGEQVGIIGLTTEDTAEISSPGEEIVINEAFAAAETMVAALEDQGVDKIIVLSHLGWNRDLALAEDVEGIDVIVGGHSHTLPERDAYPTVVDGDATPTLVVQAGENGAYLGRLDVTFDAEGVPVIYDGATIAVAAKDAGGNYLYPEDQSFKSILEGYKAELVDIQTQVVGQTAVLLDGERAHVRSQETNLGNLIADAMLAKASELARATIAITNGGGIRASIDAGDITLGQVLTVMPYGNTLMVTDLTGAQIKEALENGVSQVNLEDPGSSAGRFPQVAGLRFTWDPAQPVGGRVVEIEVANAQGGYTALDPEATYTVATNNFMYNGGDGYTVFTAGENPVELGFVDYEVLVEYLDAHSPVSPRVEGRITRTSAPEGPVFTIDLTAKWQQLGLDLNDLEPEFVAMLPDGSGALVTIQEGSAVAALENNGGTWRLADIFPLEAEAEPDGIAIGGDGELAATANEENQTISLLDLSQGLSDISLVNTVDVLELLADETNLKKTSKGKVDPEGITILTRDNKDYALVALEKSACLLVLDITDPQNVEKVTLLPVGETGGAANPDDREAEPEGVATSQDGSLIAVGNEEEGTVTLFEVTDGPDGVAFSAPVNFNPSGEEAEIVSFTPDGNRLLVTNSKEDTVILLNVADLEAISEEMVIEVADYGEPTSVAVHPSGAYALLTVADGDDPTVNPGKVLAFSLKDGSLGEIFEEFAVGQVPDSLAISGDGNWAVVANEAEDSDSIPGSIAVIDLAGLTPPEAPEPEAPKNVILLIGDGMGFEQMEAYRDQAGEPIYMDQVNDASGEVTTYSADAAITDSAAAATAITTGYKTLNRMLGMTPDDDNWVPDEVPTILELAEAKGLASGIVATSQVAHATPAGFASHVPHRNQFNNIAAQYHDNFVPQGQEMEVILGGQWANFTPEGRQAYYEAVGQSVGDANDTRNLLDEFADAGYTYVDTAQELAQAPEDKPLLGLFTEADGLTPEHQREEGTTEPHLYDMTAKALEVLAQDEDGFFVMVEGSQIDWAGHDNDFEYLLDEMEAFDLSVQAALEFQAEHPETLVIVTADHETGGLDYNPDDDSYIWKSEDHTAVNIPIMAEGPGAAQFSGTMDNTEIARKVADVLELPQPLVLQYEEPAVAGQVNFQVTSLGLPVANATVAIEASDGTPVTSLATDGEGWVEAELGEAEYTVEAAKDGYVSAQLDLTVGPVEAAAYPAEIKSISLVDQDEQTVDVDSLVAGQQYYFILEAQNLSDEALPAMAVLEVLDARQQVTFLNAMQTSVGAGETVTYRALFRPSAAGSYQLKGLLWNGWSDDEDWQALAEDQEVELQVQ